jgi:hypothetical protein
MTLLSHLALALFCSSALAEQLVHDDRSFHSRSEEISSSEFDRRVANNLDDSEKTHESSSWEETEGCVYFMTTDETIVEEPIPPDYTSTSYDFMAEYSEINCITASSVSTSDLDTSDEMTVSKSDSDRPSWPPFPRIPIFADNPLHGRKCPNTEVLPRKPRHVHQRNR